MRKKIGVLVIIIIAILTIIYFTITKIRETITDTGSAEAWSTVSADTTIPVLEENQTLASDEDGYYVIQDEDTVKIENANDNASLDSISIRLPEGYTLYKNTSSDTYKSMHDSAFIMSCDQDDSAVISAEHLDKSVDPTTVSDNSRAVYFAQNYVKTVFDEREYNVTNPHVGSTGSVITVSGYDDTGLHIFFLVKKTGQIYVMSFSPSVDKNTIQQVLNDYIYAITGNAVTSDDAVNYIISEDE